MNETHSSLWKTASGGNNSKPSGQYAKSIRPTRFVKNGKNHIDQRVYDFLVGPVTHLCYEAGLNHFSDNASVLDVGIGNGFMIPHHHALIKSKGLKITGIDISPAALEQCARRVKTYGLEDQIELQRSSIEDFQPPTAPSFDFIFFSMTFMLMKDQRRVLDRVRRMIPDKGEIVFFQTMFKERAPFMNFIKPRLKYITGIDFGPVSYDDDFFSLLKSQRLLVKENRLLHKTWFQGEYRIITAAPESHSGEEETLSSHQPYLPG